MSENQYYEKLIMELLLLSDGWDSYNAPCPNEKSINTAKDVLNCLSRNELYPTKIMPSVEGGVYFLFTKSNKYADLECYNDGHLVASMSDSSDGMMEPITWYVHLGNNKKSNIDESIKKILSFLYS